MNEILPKRAKTVGGYILVDLIIIFIDKIREDYKEKTIIVLELTRT